MSDTYWSRNPEERDSDGLTGLRGYSPAPGLSAYRMGSQDSLPTLSRQGSGIATGSYGLSPSALDPNNFSAHFSMPRFAQAGPGDAFGYSGVGVVQPTGTPMESLKPTTFGASPVNTPSAQYPYTAQQQPYQQVGQEQPHQQNLQLQQRHNSNGADSNASTSSAPYPHPSAPQDSQNLYVPYGQSNPNSTGPVYAPYGSSIISVNQPAYKPVPLGITLPPSAPGPSTFNPNTLGLPVPPPNGMTNNFAGLYSSSGFDMLGVLARVAARPNPQLSIGAVDTSCAFLVVDAKRWDQPIVFASDTFSKMTGYTSDEIIGRNCRFLQSPDAQTTQGAPRKYTDSNAAWHMRTHIAQGKESQSSLINYKKDGKPFINLVTIVPIAWDSDEVAYFVGFQVDLVDQPNAILDRMKDGTYVINYSLTSNAGAQRMSNATTVSMQSIENEALDAQEEMWHEPTPAVEEKPVAHHSGVGAAAAAHPNGTGAGVAEGIPITEMEALDRVSTMGVEGLQTEAEKRAFHKLLLSESDDFVHVLSLKGSFLYCSPSCARVLEYQPSELIGKTLPTLCHPSDVVPVMRLLKDCSSVQNPTVSLLYRVRRKHSGYVWLESSGKLHIEPGKGRKCVILVGRPREVFKMSWNDLRQAGGLGDTEFWMNLSPRGTVLASTAASQNVLGLSSQDLMGTSLLNLAQAEHVSAIQQALAQCAQGTASTVRYRVKSRRGYSDVVTRFYPHQIDEPDDLMPPAGRGPQHINIIAQTNEVTSEQRKNNGPFAALAPHYTGGMQSVRSPSADSSSTGGSSSSGSFQSTFKQLTHPSAVNDNVFDELESRRPTSWQFELHQLQNTNRKLREEKDHVLSMTRKRGYPGMSAPPLAKRTSSNSSRASNKSNRGRGCANCGKMDSPEWRAGPTGLKTLCNACGLRWAKTQRQSSEAASVHGGQGVDGEGGSGSRSNSNSSGNGGGGTPSFSPYPGSMDMSDSPATWMQ